MDVLDLDEEVLNQPELQTDELRIILEDAGIFMTLDEIDRCFPENPSIGDIRGEQPGYSRWHEGDRPSVHTRNRIAGHAKEVGYHSIKFKDSFHDLKPDSNAGMTFLRRTMGELLQSNNPIDTARYIDALLFHTYGLNRFNMERSLGEIEIRLLNLKFEGRIRSSLLPAMEEGDYDWHRASLTKKDHEKSGGIFKITYLQSSGDVSFDQLNRALDESGAESLTLRQLLAFFEEYHPYFIPPAVALGQFVKLSADGRLSPLSKVDFDQMDHEAHYHQGGSILAAVISPVTPETNNGAKNTRYSLELQPLRWNDKRRRLMIPGHWNVMVAKEVEKWFVEEQSQDTRDWLGEARGQSTHPEVDSDDEIKENKEDEDRQDDDF